MHPVYTRRDLIDRVLIELGAMASGQTPSAEDVDAVDLLIEPMSAELEGRDVARFDNLGDHGPSGGDIDPGLFLLAARWLANTSSSFWGGQYSYEKQQIIEADMRKITWARPTHQVAVGEYF